VSVQLAGAVGRQLPSVGHFRVMRGSQGTECGCVVMSAECREGPSCATVPLSAAHRIQCASHRPTSGSTVHQLSEIPSGLTDSIDAYSESQTVFREPASLPKDEQVTLAGTFPGLRFLKVLFRELRLISQFPHPLCSVVCTSHLSV
jgi:hypothetical protein